MDTAGSAIPAHALHSLLAAFPPPTLIDVRAQAARERDAEAIAGSWLRNPDSIEAWADRIDPWRPVVVYCVHGHERSQHATAALASRGLPARYLAGGLDAWREAGFATKPLRPPTRWVTRERPKIDRIACPWLISRFIDPAAEFFYVPNGQVLEFAASNGAEPYDVPDVRYTHAGDQCSFDAFIRIHALSDPALDALALIVRGADTAALELAPQAPGLKAFSLGLSRMFTTDLTMLHWGMLFYDSLYVWCREAYGEPHGWDAAKLRAA